MLKKVNFDAPAMISAPKATTTYPILPEIHVDPDTNGLEFVGDFIDDAPINNELSWLIATEYPPFLDVSLSTTLGDYWETLEPPAELWHESVSCEACVTDNGFALDPLIYL